MQKASTAPGTGTTRPRGTSRAATSRRTASTPKPLPTLDLSTFHQPVLDAIAGLPNSLQTILKEQLSEFSLSSMSTPGVTSESADPVDKVQAFSWIVLALDKLRDVLVKKGQDYSSHGEFGNFEEQARVAGVQMRQVFRGAVAQKLSREATIAGHGYEANESYFDTVLDTAGYAVLWLAWQMKQETLAS
jgi:hypothetical protein